MNLCAEFEVQEITDFTALARLEPQWNHLWERCLRATPFQRPEWLLCWMETFNPGSIWTLALRNSGQLVAIAPMYIQSKETERILAPLGAAISDYLDWLLDARMADDALACMLKYMQKNNSAWSGFDFSDLPGDSPLLKAQLDDFKIESKFHDSCPVLQLPASVDDLKNVVPRRKLRSVKSGQKKLQKAGEVCIEVATRETLDELLNALFRLHQTRWEQSGQSGVFADHQVRAFHRRIAPVLLEKGVLRLYGLRFEKKIIASLYALFEKEIAYCYLQGFDPEFADFSPGALILYAVIEDAIREGKRAIDFLRGREAYKYAWGARDVPTFRLRAHRLSAIRNILPERIAA